MPQLAELVFQADGKSEAVVLCAGRAPVHIGTNRRLESEEGIVMKPNPGGPVIPWVDVLRVDRLDGRPAAILFSHAAHPVIIHGSSRLISAEFPGFATRKLRDRLGGNVITMFGQAFGGNINADPLRGGIAAAEHAGEVLAEAAFRPLPVVRLFRCRNSESHPSMLSFLFSRCQHTRLRRKRFEKPKFAR